MTKLSELPTDKLCTLLPKSVLEQWEKNKLAGSLADIVPIGSEVLAEALAEALDEVAQLEAENERLKIFLNDAYEEMEDDTLLKLYGKAMDALKAGGD